MLSAASAGVTEPLELEEAFGQYEHIHRKKSSGEYVHMKLYSTRFYLFLQVVAGLVADEVDKLKQSPPVVEGKY